MDDRNSVTTTPPSTRAVRGGWIVAALLYAALCTAPAPTADGADHVNRFAGPKTTLKPGFDKTTARLAEHRVVVEPGGARSYEYLRFDSAGRREPGETPTVDLFCPLPKARVFDELELSLWWTSTHPGARLHLQIVLPEFRDPRTRKPIVTLIEIARCRNAGKWEKLRGGVSERAVQARIRQLRERFSNPRISSQGMFVNGLVVVAALPPGKLQMGVGELRFGPIVSPAAVQQKVAGDEEPEKDEPDKHPAEFRLDRLRVDDYPFFPRLTPHHGERPEDLQQAGVNVVWIPRFDDVALLRALHAHKLWAMATPPSSPFAAGDRTAARRLPTMGTDTEPILFWNVGTRLTGSSKKELIEWIDRLRRADRRYDRPILADVAGDEQILSRYISMLGTSRHPVNTSFSFLQYRDWLITKRNLARAGSFLWTWIQTEPADEDRRPFAEGSSVPFVVEPEQIRLQVYSALAAGYRGVGYWKKTPLDATFAGATERRMMMAQLNLELDLLTPWTSTGKVVAQTPFQVERRNEEQIGHQRLGFGASPAQRNALLNERQAQLQRRKADSERELQAAVIRSEYGTLLLPIWYENGAQFVPGRMTARNAKIVVHGISESASAWLVTTTEVHSLPQERVTGGIQVTIPRFDQTAAVVLTPNRRLADHLKRRVERIAPDSARYSSELARAKLDRVRKVNDELSELGFGQPDAPQLLHKAGALVAEAESALERREYNAARLHSDNAMQYLRILQRAHWNRAVQSLSSPVSSPYTVCFQTLPEHWRLVSRFGKSRPDRRGNVLRSGNFEDLPTMLAEGWEHAQNSTPAVRSVAELYPKGKKGNYSLRLVAAAVHGKDSPAWLGESPVTVTSPAITVKSGQIAHISGWVYTATPIVAGPEGVVVYDSLNGPRQALRWNKQQGWQNFALLREVAESGDMRLTFALHGLGEVRFDELKVVLHDPATPLAKADDETPKPRGGLNFIDRLPKLPTPKLPSIPRPSIPRWTRDREE